MITRRDAPSTSAFPKREAMHSPKAGFRDHQPSSAARFAHLRQRGEQMRTAIAGRTMQPLASQALTGSQRDNLDRHDANGRARVTVDQRLANLAALANGVVFSRSSVAGIETAGSAIGKGCQDAVRLRHCESGGDERVRGYGHRKVSLLDVLNIGPMALASQEGFSA